MIRSKTWIGLGIATWAIGAGCATTGQGEPLDYRFEDQPDERRVEVRYRNTGKKGICVTPENWPNQAGKLNQASDRVFLHVAGRSFAVEDFNTGYCPRGCATYVAPGAEIVGVIEYRDFALPAELERLPKRLEFTPHGFVCRAP